MNIQNNKLWLNLFIFCRFVCYNLTCSFDSLYLDKSVELVCFTILGNIQYNTRRNSALYFGYININICPFVYIVDNFWFNIKFDIYFISETNSTFVIFTSEIFWNALSNNIQIIFQTHNQFISADVNWKLYFWQSIFCLYDYQLSIQLCLNNCIIE